MFILTIAQLDTLDQFCFFFHLFIQFTQVLATWSLLLVCVVAVKVDLRAYEDKVRVNYFFLILNQREMQTDYAESKEKHTREI